MTNTATAILFLIAANAHAMNVKDVPVKCTEPGGKVTYQTGSCPAGSKIEVARTDQIKQQESGDAWQHTRTTDSMTGQTTCAATSPQFYSRSKHYFPVHRVVVVPSQREPSIGIIIVDNKTTYHHNTLGTGIKVGEMTLVPFSGRTSQTLVMPTPGTTAALVDAMHQANGIRIRARYWPWDETRDSDLLPMTGFKQAYALAKACAGM